MTFFEFRSSQCSASGLLLLPTGSTLQKLSCLNVMSIVRGRQSYETLLWLLFRQICITISGVTFLNTEASIATLFDFSERHQEVLYKNN